MLRLKMSGEQGLQFLEKFIKIDSNDNTLIDFDAVSQTPEYNDRLQIIDWRYKEWGCCNLSNWNCLNVLVEDYHCKCCPILPTYDVKLFFENNKLIMEEYEHEYVESKTEKYSMVEETKTTRLEKNNQQNYYSFLKKYKEELNEVLEDNSTCGFDYCTIYLNFYSDDIPLKILKAWDKEYEFIELDMLYFMNAKDIVGRVVSDDEESNSFILQEYNDDQDIYYETLISVNKLNYEHVFKDISRMLFDLCKQYGYCFSEDLSTNIIIGLEKMKDRPKELAKIITSVKKMHVQYINSVIKENGERKDLTLDDFVKFMSGE
jgi:hypothetical protein